MHLSSLELVMSQQSRSEVGHLTPNEQLVLVKDFLLGQLAVLHMHETNTYCSNA